MIINLLLVALAASAPGDVASRRSLDFEGFRIEECTPIEEEMACLIDARNDAIVITLDRDDLNSRTTTLKWARGNTTSIVVQFEYEPDEDIPSNKIVILTQTGRGTEVDGVFYSWDLAFLDEVSGDQKMDLVYSINQFELRDPRWRKLLVYLDGATPIGAGKILTNEVQVQEQLSQVSEAIAELQKECTAVDSPVAKQICSQELLALRSQMAFLRGLSNTIKNAFAG